MNKVSVRFFVICMFYFSITNIKAQITMGSDFEPNKGALLDIKEWDTTNGGKNSNKGMMLPRVALTVRNDITADISGVTAVNSRDHIGLVVYNVNEDACAADPLVKGPYIWDGNEWIYLLSQNTVVKTYTDNRDPDNPVTYRYRDFGNAGVWMLDNLVAKRFDGESTDMAVYSGTSAGSTTPLYSYPNASATAWGTAPAKWDQSLGLLYSWAAATGKKTTVADEGEGSGSPNTGTVENIGVQGICPDGWHLPSDKEWNALEKEISENPSAYSTVTTPVVWLTDYNYPPSGRLRGSHGEAMKSSCVVPGTVAATGGKSTGSTTGGFNVKLVGVINTAKVVNYGTGSIMWSSSSAGSSNGWVRGFSNVNAGVNRVTGSRPALYSVRCKQN